MIGLKSGASGMQDTRDPKAQHLRGVELTQDMQLLCVKNIA